MKKILFVIAVFCSLSIQSQSLKVVFRYDDFILKSDSLDEKIVSIFQKYRVSLVLAVIPCNKKETPILETNYSFLPTLKNGIHNNSIEIALHGLTHQRLANGEFDNLSIQEQRRRIVKGKNLLDSIFQTNVTTFVPPFNAYDVNTLKVMQQLGFNSISSALCIGQSWSNPHINYYPETIENFETLLSVFEHNKNRDGVVVVMFHHYTFMNDFTLAQLDSLLAKINQLSYLRCVTFSQLNKEKQVSDTKRMQANMESNLMSKYMHLNAVIQTTTFAVFVRIFNITLYLVLSGLFYYLATLIMFRNRLMSNNRKYSIGFMLLLFVGLCVWFHLLAPLKLALFVIMISICISLVSKIK